MEKMDICEIKNQAMIIYNNVISKYNEIEGIFIHLGHVCLEIRQENGIIKWGFDCKPFKEYYNSLNNDEQRLLIDELDKLIVG